MSGGQRRSPSLEVSYSNVRWRKFSYYWRSWELFLWPPCLCGPLSFPQQTLHPGAEAQTKPDVALALWDSGQESAFLIAPNCGRIYHNWGDPGSIPKVGKICWKRKGWPHQLQCCPGTTSEMAPSKNPHKFGRLLGFVPCWKDPWRRLATHSSILATEIP